MVARLSAAVRLAGVERQVDVAAVNASNALSAAVSTGSADSNPVT